MYVLLGCLLYIRQLAAFVCCHRVIDNDMVIRGIAMFSVGNHLVNYWLVSITLVWACSGCQFKQMCASLHVYAHDRIVMVVI